MGLLVWFWILPFLLGVTSQRQPPPNNQQRQQPPSQQQQRPPQQQQRPPQRQQPGRNPNYPQQQQRPQQRTVCNTVCYCQQSQAYCAEKGISSMPKDPWPYGLTRVSFDQNRFSSLPKNAFNIAELRTVQGLSISFNMLKTIKADTFTGLSGLRELAINSNHLTSLEKGAFNGLSALETIHLKGNRIETLEPGAFSSIPRLNSINLDGNNLKTIPSEFFDQVHQVAALTLSNNPWKCDCNLLALFVWMKSGKQIQGKAPTCKSPENMAGRNIQGFAFKDFQKICSEDWKAENTPEPTPSPEVIKNYNVINESCTNFTSSLAIEICFISSDVYVSPGAFVCIHCIATRNDSYFGITGSGLEHDDDYTDLDDKQQVNVTWETPSSPGDVSDDGGARFRQHENGSLCIGDVKVADGGTYQCQAKAKNYTFSKSVSVSVANLPMQLTIGTVTTFFVFLFICAAVFIRWWNAEMRATAEPNS